MKKIFLVLTLLVSGFGFTDWKMTLLDCENTNDKSDFPEKLSVRIDESKRKLRINLMTPSIFGEEENYFLAMQMYNEILYEIKIYTQDLYVDFGRKPKDDRYYEREFYSCRII